MDRIKRFLKSLQEKPVDTVSMIIFLSFVGVAVGGASALFIGAWAEYPALCAFLTAITAALFGEHLYQKELSKDEGDRIETFTQAASYFFTVARFMSEVKPGGEIIASNETHEIVVRQKKEPA